MAYVNPPITVDPEALLQEVFRYLQDRAPGWEPADGNLDVWLAEAFAQVAAQVAEVASDVPASIFRYYGANVAGLPPREATFARGATSWTVIPSSSGRFLPAGTTLAADVEGETVAFTTDTDTMVPPDADTVSGVAVTAVEAGAVGTGITGAADLLDPLDYVTAIEFDSPTFGGQDAEPDDEYLDRLADELRLLTPRPILPSDFAILAQRVDGVGRGLAIDGYNPVDDSYGNERMVAVAVADEAGEPCSQGVKTAVDDLLQGHREVTFVVNVIDPSYTVVDVKFKAVAWPGFDATVVEQNAIEAIRAFLAPRDWGQPDYGELRAWHNESVVRVGELYAVLNSVEGLRYVSELSLAKEGDPLGTVDVQLGGPAPLPRPGDVVGEVT